MKNTKAKTSAKAKPLPKISAQAKPAPTGQSISFEELARPTSGSVSNATVVIVRCMRMIDSMADALENNVVEDPGWDTHSHAKLARDWLHEAMDALEKALSESVRESKQMEAVAGDPAKSQDKWQRLMELFSGDPMIHPRLKALEKIAGSTPPIQWLAAALHEFISHGSEECRQTAFMETICEASGQEYKLTY